MERYHEMPHELNLTPNQRSMYFQLGAEQENNLSRNLGFRVDANYAHERALVALNSVNWASLKAARAMLSLMR